MAAQPEVPASTTVAIVGGGPVGLISSILLSQQGIEHILLERQPDTAIHPKAVGLNQRTMELLRRIGLEDEVWAHASPECMSKRTAWYTSFGPEGREICSRYAWGGGEFKEDFQRASPCGYALLPQIRFEPLLKKRALELNPGRIFFEREVVGVDEGGDHAVVHFRHRQKRAEAEDATPRTLSAKYVLGCDGGRMLVKHLGIPMNGEADVVDMVFAHVRAPISLHRPDPSIFIHWFISPKLGGSLKTGALYHLGPYPMQPETEEWMFGCARLPWEQAKPFTEQDMLERMRRTLQVPDLEVEFLSLSHWFVNAICAARYRSSGGRVFLVGDAAHRVPPWGALGLNTGAQDADNLVWKLKLALDHPDMDFGKLLDTYDLERRPIGQRVADKCLLSMRSHAGVLDRAIGLLPDQSEEENVRAMEQYFDPSDKGKGEAKRKEVEKALKILDMEFHAPGAEVGWFYNLDYDAEYDAGKAIGRHPQLNDNDELEICEYFPSVKPGSQLPHAWLVSKADGKWTSTRELMLKDKLVLLVTSSKWRKIQHASVETIVISDEDGDYSDEKGQWTEICDDSAFSGAVLVRPDSIIAYRWADDDMLQVSDPQEEMSNIVKKVLRLEVLAN